MKYITAILVALMAVVGMSSACIETGFGSFEWGMTGETAGATYYESGSAYLVTADTFDMSTSMFNDNKGNLGQEGFMTTSDPRDGDGTSFAMTQRMDFIKDFAAPVDPTFSNSVVIHDGTVGLTWFAGSKYEGVQMGMSMDNLYNPSSFGFYGFSELTQGHMTGGMDNHVGMYFDAKDKFSFDRMNQLYTGAMQFNATKLY